MYHKQRGYLVTNYDPEGRSTIFDQLKNKAETRFISVGRLDMDSEGLILLTNDGDLARKLELPSTGWLRKYSWLGKLVRSSTMASHNQCVRGRLQTRCAWSTQTDMDCLKRRWS